MSYTTALQPGMHLEERHSVDEAMGCAMVPAAIVLTVLGFALLLMFASI